MYDGIHDNFYLSTFCRHKLQDLNMHIVNIFKCKYSKIVVDWLVSALDRRFILVIFKGLFGESARKTFIDNS